MITDAIDKSIETISELRERIATGVIAQAEIRAAVRRRLAEKRNLNAFISELVEDDEDVDSALPLAGIPVGIKDFFDTAGVRTTAGFVHFANRVPAEDAELVKRLKAAGAMIVGKTNMHVLGMGTTSLESHFGPVRNPWAPDHVAGGSSGGSAAAIAAGICFATIDTDAVGSARLPAACCAVTGFKPSFGVLSQKGILEGEPVDPTILALSHAAILARGVADVETIFSILADVPFEPAMAEPRLGVATNFSASDAIRRAFEETLPAITALAASHAPVEVPFSEARFDPSAIDEARGAINARLFGDVDLIVLPTLADTVPTIEDARKAGDQAVSPDNTFFANYFGLPAITVPVGFDRFGAPIGLQIVGRRGGDITVLAFARRVQETFPPVLAGNPLI